MASDLDVTAADPSGRLGREQAFHNRRFAEGAQDPRTEVRKLYRSLRRLHDTQRHLLCRLGTGRTVLEYGCADGTLSLEELGVPGFAARLEGIDIADEAVAAATHKAARLGFTNARFQQMDAEAMTFPDASFDVIYGRGILHHLDLGKSLRELARVLRPGGTALFLEPLGHNPVINRYRRRTPDLRTADEHPLLRSDFTLARWHFGAVDSVMGGLTTPLAVAAERRLGLGGLLPLSEALDRVLLMLPGIKWQAWHACMILRK